MIATASNIGNNVGLFAGIVSEILPAWALLWCGAMMVTELKCSKNYEERNNFDFISELWRIWCFMVGYSKVNSTSTFLSGIPCTIN